MSAQPKFDDDEFHILDLGSTLISEKNQEVLKNLKFLVFNQLKSGTVQNKNYRRSAMNND